MLGRGINLIVATVLVIFTYSCTQRNSSQVAGEYSGSESCIECHDKFYKLWQPSYHGQAMMPVNSGFIAKHRLPDSQPIEVEGHMFTVEFRDSTMMLYEKDGDKLIKTYEVLWAMGGHNVYCFLTPFEKGKLQNIPLAYDANGKTWFNYPESGVRHFGDEYPEDEALPWKDAMYAFNTGCYSCHISQLSSNFDLSTETYHTTWREAGINCETCHGPGGEHIRIFKNLKEGEEAKDIGLIVTSTFTPEQNTDACATCHSKMNPITPSYMPGDKYFDNYNLTTLEDLDFYPDGRSLGENYTLTGWKMNPCLEGSDLNCVTCHTSSGRDRNKDNPDNSCLQCHTDKAENIQAHTGHKKEDGLTCLSCHMPKRQFVGRFLRSDHSFRPPMPEATIQFGSPNACNQCHTDKSPEWANKIVKARPNGNYQEETLKWAQLIKEARDNDWTNVDKMYKYIADSETNEVVANSLIRLLANCTLDSKINILLEALNNKSELVRSSAAGGLGGIQTAKVKDALLKACEDEIRLVRIQAVNAILTFPENSFTAEELSIVQKTEKEYVTSMTSRLDNWSNHYNLGIYYQNKGNVDEALNSYETAARLYPESMMPLINSSVLYSYVGNTEKAEENLKKAVEVDPENEAANLNLGLLLAEKGKMGEAEKALKNALKVNPEQAVAAYNLSVITAPRDLNAALQYAKIAADARPDEPKYAYTLAYYQMENNNKKQAVTTLKTLLDKNPLYYTAVSFLAEIYLRDGKKQDAIKLYEKTLKTEGVSDQDKAGIRQAIASIQQSM
ncbi:ammonia-forming cytochrome c nitrite reductase subunit c552 [Maribellus comscasis]|uniref:Ammonia-forming cytochrome c nitrite reductase subunit c552 n=1 Tax=Maribellus comscasis TaxID=2681766 RepID=A0A6I6JRV4_9BACT|nr:ammonia-forming cytochrome c nitrite reductase subunit c552 [Maribellus comscasis]QGY42882.1 ammonia-forming cytochrome c nitrite reductase subunit c552 [Maribellus comscasis]